MDIILDISQDEIDKLYSDLRIYNLVNKTYEEIAIMYFQQKQNLIDDFSINNQIIIKN